jgi:SHS2 domain-containing protein
MQELPRDALDTTGGPVPAAGWEHFEHEADVGVRGWGRSLAEAFERAAVAVTAAITDPATVRAEGSVNVECRAADRELLLVEWLNAVIYEMSARGWLFNDFRVTIDGPLLRGVLRGEPVDRGRHQPAVEPKGATCTELRVAERADGNWFAQCVIDV